MRRKALPALLAVALAFALPLLLSPAPSARTAPPAEPETPVPAAETSAPVRRAVLDETLTLAVRTADGVREMTMAEYLPAALAGEMPAAFHPEALRAQAVALRSYALHFRAARKDAHPDADVCTSPACCAAFADDAALRARWGAEFARYASKMRAAAADTDGQYLVWEDEPILAVFHAASAGQTEAGGALGVAAPYLVSVPSPETAETVAALESTVEVSSAEFRGAVASVAPDAVFGDDPAAWLGAVTRTESGRVASVQIGGAAVSGLALRQLFSLRSADFSLAWDGSCFRFSVRGSGHGVGMSQYGADLLAEGGASYAEILAHYYPGTRLVIAMAAA